MIENQIARRYAKALAEACDAEGILSKAQKDLTFLVDMLDPNRGEISVPELLVMLYGPRVPKADKMRLADTLAEKLALCKPVCELLKALIRRNRIALMSNIEAIFHKLASARRNVTPAIVESASRLPDAEREAIREALQKTLGGTVEIFTRIRPAILGGLRVRVRNRLIDGSLAGKLDRLEQRFAKL